MSLVTEASFELELYWRTFTSYTVADFTQVGRTALGAETAKAALAGIRSESARATPRSLFML
jgi:hypothetical protein